MAQTPAQDSSLTETGVETINWNDGQSTSFPFTATAANVGSNTVLTILPL